MFACIINAVWRQWNVACKQFNSMDKDAASIEDVTENVTDPEAVEFLKKNQGISTYIIYMH